MFKTEMVMVVLRTSEYTLAFIVMLSTVMPSQWMATVLSTEL